MFINLKLDAEFFCWEWKGAVNDDVFKATSVISRSLAGNKTFHDNHLESKELIFSNVIFLPLVGAKEMKSQMVLLCGGKPLQTKF